MANLFLDIETVPNFTREQFFKLKHSVDSGMLQKDSQDNELFWRYERGGLTPFEGKIILITFQVNDGHIFRLKEWELGEEQLLKRFYQLVGDLQYRSEGDRLQVIGHNILRFDLFYLYERMKHYKIDDIKWLHQRIINKPEVVDFLQMHLPLNDFKTKGLKHDVIMHAYDFPTKTTLGSEEVVHYFQGDYDKIIQYSMREFVYPALYQKITTQGLVSKAKLQESIKWYEKIHESVVA